MESMSVCAGPGVTGCELPWPMPLWVALSVQPSNLSSVRPAVSGDADIRQRDMIAERVRGGVFQVVGFIDDQVANSGSTRLPVATSARARRG